MTPATVYMIGFMPGNIFIFKTMPGFSDVHGNADETEIVGYKSCSSFIAQCCLHRDSEPDPILHHRQVCEFLSNSADLPDQRLFTLPDKRIYLVLDVVIDLTLVFANVII